MDSDSIKRAAKDWGAHKVCVADLKRLEGIHTSPANLLDGHKSAISIAVRLSSPVMDDIKDRPTPLYARHYQMVNALLDDIALRVAGLIQKRSGSALPLPASQVLDTESFTSYLSHKAVAVAAGIGWQGKSLLTVSPEFGPRIRLVTVLTNLDLEPDEPIRNRCGNCSACADACPAGAIRNVNTDSHYQDREEALHFDRCVQKTTQEFRNLPLIGASICGVCITVCPWGRPSGEHTMEKHQ